MHKMELLTHHPPESLGPVPERRALKVSGFEKKPTDLLFRRNIRLSRTKILHLKGSYRDSFALGPSIKRSSLKRA